MTTIDPHAPLEPWSYAEAGALVKQQMARNHRGARPINAKLTVTEVKQIRETYHLGKARVIDLADQYGVKQRAIYSVLSRETWRDVA